MYTVSHCIRPPKHLIGRRSPLHGHKSKDLAIFLCLSWCKYKSFLLTKNTIFFPVQFKRKVNFAQNTVVEIRTSDTTVKSCYLGQIKLNFRFSSPPAPLKMPRPIVFYLGFLLSKLSIMFT